ncbi:MAG: carbohydrate kinase family protein [Granulicella sp.]
MNQYDVAVVGEIYIDHIFTGFTAWPQPGEEAFAPDYHREIGGGAANTACALGRLGRTVNLIGAIGASDGDWFEERLLEFSVSSQGIKRCEGSTGVTASVSMRNDRSFFTYVGENGRLLDILRSKSILDTLGSARHVHFALPLDHGLASVLLPALRASGCSTSLDVGFQPAWLSSPEVLDTCRATDYFLPNEREALLLSGGDVTDYLDFAGEKGLRAPLIKLGSRGAAMKKDGKLYEVASPLVDVIDTTGAGDAFDAGFIDALLDDAGPEACLRRACICGGLSTRLAGALQGLPFRKEIGDIYEQTYTS